MANPISLRLEDKRESGFQRKGEQDAESAPLDAIVQAHNQALVERAGSLFELPLVVLTEQRDQALARLVRAEQSAAELRQRWVAEQDRFIGSLMAEHEAKLRELEANCERLRAELEASRADEHDADALDVTLVTERAWDEPELETLKRALEAANVEIDETRADALRLQEERDEAIRATDDVRLELMSELESSRDESFRLESQLDEAHRLLEDVRDQAREEVLRLTEEAADLRAELAARNDELQRLRARLLAATGPGSRQALPRRSSA